MRDEILMVAGEASADLHGAHVLRALKSLHPSVRAYGIGGVHLRQEGMHLLARAEEISLCGLTEVLTALPRLFRIMRRVEHLAARRRPRVALLIDLPDFNLRLATRLRRLGIAVVYFISPQIWAWRERRVKHIARVVTEMLVILPFEASFYAKHGVPARFVGHPLVEQLGEPMTGEAARAALEIAPDAGPVVALLPGSREQELARHLPTALGGLACLVKSYPDLRILLPLAPTVRRASVEAHLAQAPALAGRVTLLEGRAKLALCASDIALVSSGTATLETALLGRPMVVMYRVSWLTYQILRRLVRVAHIALVNLIANERLMVELVQHDFQAPKVAAALDDLLAHPEKRALLETRLKSLRARLGEHPTAYTVAEALIPYLQVSPPPHLVPK